MAGCWCFAIRQYHGGFNPENPGASRCEFKLRRKPSKVSRTNCLPWQVSCRSAVLDKAPQQTQKLPNVFELKISARVLRKLTFFNFLEFSTNQIAIVFDGAGLLDVKKISENKHTKLPPFERKLNIRTVGQVPNTYI